MKSTLLVWCLLLGTLTEVCSIQAQNLQISFVQLQQPLCLNDNTGLINIAVSGGQAPYSFSWKRTGATTIIGNTNTIANLTYGMYEVIVSDASEPVQTITQQFSVQPINDLGISGVETTASYADEPTGSAKAWIVGGQAPYTFDWSAGIKDSVSNNTVSHLPVGNHEVFITDGNGCTATQDFTIPSLPTLVIQIQAEAKCGCDAKYCATPPLGTSGPFQYQWSSGEQGNCAQALCAGPQTVTVIDALGNSYSRDFTVLGAQKLEISVATLAPGTPIAPTGSATVLAQGGTLPYSYQWTGTEKTDSLVYGLRGGLQYVLVSDAQGCDSLIEFIMPAGDAAQCLQANTILTPDADGHNDLLIFSCLGLSEIGSIEVSVFNKFGQLVFQSDNYQNDWSGIDTQAQTLPAGAYYWQARGYDGETTTRKNSGHLTILKP